ncbi:unnamed protein product [Oppiella nova]|uniref:Uncharacterized protein n=1 Tax=Oppiella nova TaxID=334625 RepID=A0A7R9LFZ4_9ACAR|nr:unnamed protein product [Oppiella nova]CAG2163206.1 unnamed protein product [Oppiella nova]
MALPTSDKKHLIIQRSLYLWCAVALVSDIVVMSITINNLINNNYNYNDNYRYKDFFATSQIAEVVVAAIGVAIIFLELVGVWAAYKQHYWLCIVYAIISTAVGALCLIGGVIIGTEGELYYSAAIFLVSSSSACYFARDIKRLKRLAWSMAVYYNGLPAPQQSIVYQVPPPAEGLPQRQMLHPGQIVPPGQMSNYGVPVQGPNGHMYAFPGSGYQSSQHQGMTSAYDSPVGTSYAQQGLQPPSYSEFEPGGSGQQLDPEPPMVGYIAPHKTMPDL